MKKTEAIKKITSFVDDTSSRLRKIALPIRNVLAFSAADDRIAYKKELCVSVDRTGVSAAYGTRFLSSFSIKGLKHFPSAEHVYPQPKEVASSVILAVRELGVAGTDITLSIPKAWTVIRLAEFPVSIKENISNAVTFELDRLVPFGPEEAFYDFSIIGQTPEKIAIVIAAARADIINGYREALKAEGLTVGRVTLNLMGLGALCRTMSKGKDFIFIGTEGDEYEGALFFDGMPGEVVNGRLDTDDDKSRAEIIAAGMKPLIDTAKKRDNAHHLFALLRGGSAALKERVRTSLASTVVMLDESAAGIGVSSDQKNIPYAAAGGVMDSLRPGPQKLNLLTRGRHEKAGIPVALTAILLVLLMALGIAYMIAPIQGEQQRLREIGRQIKLLKNDVKDSETLRKEMEALNSEVATINSFKENRPMTLTILKELTTILPKSAWLTRMRVVESRVEIEGYASSASELLSRLEASKYFGKAEFASPTFRDVRMNSDRFNIKMEIKGIKVEKGTPRKDEKK